MIDRVVSVCYLLFIGLVSIPFFAAALLIWLCTVGFDRRLVALHMFTSFWASVYLWTMPAWSVAVGGREKIDRAASYIIVSNHQSQLDILVAFRLFIPFKWVSKIEVFRLPFIGWNMSLNGYIKLKRGDRKSIEAMMAACEKTIREGNSVWFFPEGTRSATGLMRPFKTGAFTLARKLKKPILPVAINGTKNALPKHSLTIRGSHNIRIEVLDAIPHSEFADLSPEETGEMVRERIAAHVDEHARN